MRAPAPGAMPSPGVRSLLSTLPGCDVACGQTLVADGTPLARALAGEAGTMEYVNFRGVRAVARAALRLGFPRNERDGIAPPPAVVRVLFGGWGGGRGQGHSCRCLVSRACLAPNPASPRCFRTPCGSTIAPVCILTVPSMRFSSMEASPSEQCPSPPSPGHTVGEADAQLVVSSSSSVNLSPCPCIKEPRRATPFFLQRFDHGAEAWVGRKALA